MTILFWIVLAFLLLVSILDWKFKFMPSVLLTGMLFILLVVNYSNVMYGLFAFVLAYFLYEFNYFEGMADIKVMTIVGLMLGSLKFLMIFAVIVTIFGFVWKISYKWKHPKAKEVPFVPVFLFCYICLWILGGIV
jgi:hypothetical protein